MGRSTRGRQPAPGRRHPAWDDRALPGARHSNDVPHATHLSGSGSGPGAVQRGSRAAALPKRDRNSEPVPTGWNTDERAETVSELLRRGDLNSLATANLRWGVESVG